MFDYVFNQNIFLDFSWWLWFREKPMDLLMNTHPNFYEWKHLEQNQEPLTSWSPRYTLHCLYLSSCSFYIYLLTLLFLYTLILLAVSFYNYLYCWFSIPLCCFSIYLSSLLFFYIFILFAVSLYIHPHCCFNIYLSSFLFLYIFIQVAVFIIINRHCFFYILIVFAVSMYLYLLCLLLLYIPALISKSCIVNIVTILQGWCRGYCPIYASGKYFSNIFC